MPIIVPNEQEMEVLTNRLTPNLTLRLYSNNYTPVPTSTTASFTEVVGGGYVNKPLIFANWTLTAGEPSVAVYLTQSWVFTGAVTGNNIYGFYVTRDTDNELMFAERLPSAIAPFVPENGSQLIYLPRYTVQSQF